MHQSRFSWLDAIQQFIDVITNSCILHRKKNFKTNTRHSQVFEYFNFIEISQCCQRYCKNFI